MQRPASICNEEEWHAICNAIVDTAQAILTENIGIIEGARKLSQFGYSAKAERDEDFLFFAGLDSETDHLPIGAVTKHWNSAALREKQKKIADAEIRYRERACEACRHLIAKYREKGGLPDENHV